MSDTSKLEEALLKAIEAHPDYYHNKGYVKNLLTAQSWGMQLTDAEQAVIDEYVILYGNPLAQPPQGIIKAKQNTNEITCLSTFA